MRGGEGVRRDPIQLAYVQRRVLGLRFLKHAEDLRFRESLLNYKPISLASILPERATLLVGQLNGRRSMMTPG
jgi:hypothetical protein